MYQRSTDGWADEDTVRIPCPQIWEIRLGSWSTWTSPPSFRVSPGLVLLQWDHRPTVKFIIFSRFLSQGFRVNTTAVLKYQQVCFSVCLRRTFKKRPKEKNKDRVGGLTVQRSYVSDWSHRVKYPFSQTNNKQLMKDASNTSVLLVFVCLI